MEPMFSFSFFFLFGVQYVVVAGDMDKPMAIAVDPVAGMLFWGDRGRMAKIESARLDGSQRRVLVSTSVISFISGLTLDPGQRRLYWCDPRFDTIQVGSLSSLLLLFFVLVVVVVVVVVVVLVVVCGTPDSTPSG